MGKNCSVLKKHEQILKYIKPCAKIDRHQRHFLNLAGELLEGILPSLHSGTSTSRKAAYCHCSHSQVLITGAEPVVRMGYKQAMNKIVSTLRTGSEKSCLLLKGEGGHTGK